MGDATGGQHALVPQQPGGGIVRADAKEAGAVALTAQIEGRIKAQTLVALNRPRNWMDVSIKLQNAMRRPVMAEGALYSKPIGGKRVEGLSIRFAEEAFRTMTNIVVETMLVSDDDDKRVYLVSGTDLETNASFPVTVVVTKQVERSSMKGDSVVLGKRTNSNGQPVYILKATSEDDYRAKEQAQLQKARRDVILFFVPGDVQEECEAVIRKTVADRDREDPKAAVNRVAELFHRVGVSVAELEKFLGHPIDAMNNAELHVLRTLHTGLKDGEFTWAKVMEEKLGTNTGADASAAAPAPTAKGSALKERLAKSAPKPAPAVEAGKAEGGPSEATLTYLRGLVARQKAGERLTDDELEELRFFQQDYPNVEL